MEPVIVVLYILAIVLLLMAILVSKGETGLIRTFNFTKVKDKNEYARFLGKAIALEALAVMLGAGICLIINVKVGIALLIILVIAALVFISKKSHKYYAN